MESRSCHKQDSLKVVSTTLDPSGDVMRISGTEYATRPCCRQTTPPCTNVRDNAGVTEGGHTNINTGSRVRIPVFVCLWSVFCNWLFSEQMWGGKVVKQLPS
ncbi:hypothetical protein Bbelb_151830 [Branchiostoma belcheri]|nr:hypothetical protein Bbelb_151830 [Branchiostoma belcheri]